MDLCEEVFRATLENEKNPEESFALENVLSATESRDCGSLAC